MVLETKREWRPISCGDIPLNLFLFSYAKVLTSEEKCGIIGARGHLSLKKDGLIYAHVLTGHLSCGIIGAKATSVGCHPDSCLALSNKVA